MVDVLGRNAIGGDDAVVVVADTKALAVVIVDPASGDALAALTDAELRADPVEVSVVGAEGGVTIEVATGDFEALGADDDAAYTDDTGAASGSMVALGKGLYVSASALLAAAATEATLGDLAAAVGAIDDAAYSDDTGAANGTAIALLKGCFVKLCEIADNTAPA